MMLSQCPKCETVFQITELQLQAKDGLVRCGHCHFVFNAAWNLLDAPPDENGYAAEPGPQSAAPARQAPPPASPEPPRDHAAAAESAARAPTKRPEAATRPQAPPPAEPPVESPAEPATDAAGLYAAPIGREQAPPPPPSVSKPVAEAPAAPPPPPDLPATLPERALLDADSEDLSGEESPSGGTPTLIVEATPAQQAALSDDGHWGWGIGDTPEDEAAVEPPARHEAPAARAGAARDFFPNHEPDEEIVLESFGAVPDDDMQAQDAKPPPASGGARRRRAGLDIPSLAEGRHTVLRKFTIGLVRRGTRRRWLWITLAIILVLLLAAQGAYFFLADMAERPFLRARMEAVCGVVHCNVPARRDLARVELLETRIAPHAERAAALELSATLVNRAPFPQDYPLIEVTLSNQRGEIVVRRTFAPTTYLDTMDPERALMPRNIAVDVVLAMTRPGPQTTGYEVRLAQAPRTRASMFRHFVADMSLGAPLREFASGLKARFGAPADDPAQTS